MKEQINKEDKMKFERLSQMFAVTFILAVITPIPLAHFLSYAGIGIWIVIFCVSLYLAILVEKEKKKFDVQTYREIIAFTEGKKLDEIEKAREEGKRPYQKILLAIISGAVTLIFAMSFAWLLGMHA